MCRREKQSMTSKRHKYIEMNKSKQERNKAHEGRSFLTKSVYSKKAYMKPDANICHKMRIRLNHN